MECPDGWVSNSLYFSDRDTASQREAEAEVERERAGKVGRVSVSSRKTKEEGKL